MHVLAIDAGTTGITCQVFEGDQHVAARAYAEIGQHYPKPGWVEHDPLEIRDTALRLAKSACKEAGIRPRDLEAIGITNQRETVVVWDDEGVPIHPAIVWQDRRTAETCRKLRRHERLVRSKTGLVIDPYFSATKIAWILDHVPGARERAEAGELKAGTIDSWLAWNLTGDHVTDPTNASRTLLWDIHSSRWDDDLLDLFEVPAAVLPGVVPSSHIIGPCKQLGNAPLAGLVGDQQGALFGQQATAAGQTKITYGTGCFLLQHTGAMPVSSKHGLLTTRAASLDETPQYALEGSVFIGGAAVQWLRDGIHMIDDAPEINALAAQVKDAGGVVVVPSFTGLGAPHWDAEARGAILGLSRGSGRAEIARATLQAIAHQCDDVMQAMTKDSGEKVEEVRVDGGAARSDILLQMQADLLGAVVRRGADLEATARGAALLAGIAVGAYSLEQVPEGEAFSPQAARSEVRASRKRWDRAVKTVSRFGT